MKLVYLPSSHSGGELPGNHNGLSGGSGSHTSDTPFVAFLIVMLLLLLNHDVVAVPCVKTF